MNDETNSISAFPLCWPDRRPRTPPQSRKHGRFKTSFSRARDHLINEIRRLGGTNPIFSSNIPRRKDGLPYADLNPKNGDPGIAAYFTRKGKQLCFACDCYLTVDDNMHAITLTVAALRGIARWGTGDMMEAAFRGFTALPENAGSSWWETLGVCVNATPDQVKESYRALIKKHHPDVGGDSEKFREIHEAYQQFESISK